MDSWSIQFGKIDMSTKGTDMYSKLRQFLENREVCNITCPNFEFRAVFL